MAWQWSRGHGDERGECWDLANSTKRDEEWYLGTRGRSSAARSCAFVNLAIRSSHYHASPPSASEAMTASNAIPDHIFSVLTRCFPAR